uniref:Prolyl 4-hydroxylase alpha subunit domain-containing protein n=1 Tax=Dunaliella tertiolecta TaxID=3047 RepID=A0A7S3VPM7_DUNTE
MHARKHASVCAAYPCCIKLFLQVLSADARIYLFRNFLSEAECDYIKNKATPRLARSGVVDAKTGKSKIDDIRTSSGMFFNRGEDPVIQTIERRIANLSMTPVYHGEGLQVLRYEAGQKYEAHWDYFFDEKNAARGANRYATMLTFLETVEEGGETVFTKMPTPDGRDNEGFSECAKHHLAVKPHKASFLL